MSWIVTAAGLNSIAADSALPLPSTALQVVTWIGAITAIFAASIAVAQNDIKRILAYSTVSQLGYMMMGLGVLIMLVVLAVPILLVAGLAACRGDTLYDAPTTPGNQGNVPPPTVSVTLPTAGAQVLAGRTMRVRAVATDTLGITLLQVDIRGAATGTVVGRFDPPRDTVVLDTTIAIPAGVTGRVEVTATARNSLGGTATTAARSVSVGGIESTAPTVAVTATVPVRMELTDRLHLHITAADNDGGSGIAQLGATVLATALALREE